MALWDTFRTAWRLAERVEEIESEWKTVRAEWADTLEIVARREERMRKRDQRALKGPERHDPPEGNGNIAPPGGSSRKQQLRAMARAQGLLQ